MILSVFPALADIGFPWSEVWYQVLLISVTLQVPKQTPKTIESMRVPDETMVSPEDEEVKKKNETIVFVFITSAVDFM